MTATENTGLGHGSNGSPQESLDEWIYSNKVEENEKAADVITNPIYDPSPKHEQSGWGSNNPIKTRDEGQQLLDSGYAEVKQIFNITLSGKIVKFQPDNSPKNGYHAYEVSKPRDIPSSILKQMLRDGRITRSEYNKFRKGKI